MGFATILVLIFRTFCYKVGWVKNCLQKIWRFFFWNFVIRFVVETAIELQISNFVRLMAYRTDSWYETFLSSISICSIAILGIYALLVTPFLQCKKDQIHSEEFKAKYGALTEGLKAENLSARFYFSFFMTRRFLVAVLIVYMIKRPGVQVLLLCLSTLLQGIYLATFKP